MGKCIDVQGGEQGTNIIVYGCHGARNQQWSPKCPLTDVIQPEDACGYGAWSDWTACSVSCGGGQMARVRWVDPAKMQSNGCSAVLEMSQCNERQCTSIPAQQGTP